MASALARLAIWMALRAAEIGKIAAEVWGFGPAARGAGGGEIS